MEENIPDNPLRMGGGQTQIPPHADLTKTSDSAKKSNTKAVTTALGRKNDVLVYELYGLTEDEIQIVEESVG